MAFEQKSQVFRFLHAADIHLDSPLRGLARYEGAPLDKLQGATRQAFRNLVDICLAEEVDLLLLAGDIYDGDWPDYNTGLFFLQQMSRLKSKDIRVVLLTGNHDAESRVSKNLRLPEHVTQLSTQAPESILFEEAKVAVHGQGFAHPAVTEDLSLGYPDPIKSYFNIGMLHTSLDGRPGHDPYAPSSLSHLKNFGYDYWALGHIHQREILCEEPWIVFCGNTQGRHVRETGRKSATLVTVKEGKVVSLEERFTDVVRWSVLSCDITDIPGEEALLQVLESLLLEEAKELEGQLLAFGVELFGSGGLHAELCAEPERWSNLIRSLTYGKEGQLWFEKLRLRTRREETAGFDGDVAGEILELIEREYRDPQSLRLLSESLFSSLGNKVPRDWRQGNQSLGLSDEEALKGHFDSALGLLEEHLGQIGEPKR